MELTGNLKDEVEKAKTKDEAKNIIEKAGMRLSDDELENVVGGIGVDWFDSFDSKSNSMMASFGSTTGMRFL